MAKKPEETNGLMTKLVKATTIDYSDVLADSEIFNNVDRVPTPVPMLNVALSGKIGGGLTAGVSLIAGPSRHFKSAFALVSAAAYLKAYPDAVMIIYDSEFGSPLKYFTSVGIDPKRVLHVPVTTLEELRTQLANHLLQIKRGDHVVLVCDSVGNLASAKEVKDAEEGSEAADLTRSRVIKSLFRIITPHLKLKNIPLIAIMHIYQELKMHGKNIISGGQGPLLAADTAFIIGRQTERDGVEVVGYDFIINIEKSRFVKEKSKIPITVSFQGGIMKWSGFFDLAREAGILTGTKSYRLATNPDGESFTRADLENNGDFWKDVLQNTALSDFIEQQFALPEGNLITEDAEVTKLEDLTSDAEIYIDTTVD